MCRRAAVHRLCGQPSQQHRPGRRGDHFQGGGTVPVLFHAFPPVLLEQFLHIYSEIFIFLIIYAGANKTGTLKASNNYRGILRFFSPFERPLSSTGR